VTEFLPQSCRRECVNVPIAEEGLLPLELSGPGHLLAELVMAVVGDMVYML
jgi:hypothetical protein